MPIGEASETAASSDWPDRGGAARDRALVIDDDASVRTALEESLVALGWTVDVAPDGFQGLARFDTGHHRLVITDLRMPGMSGLEVAQSVRARVPATAVVLMSGMVSLGTLERARELGVRVLAKPIDLDTLKSVVQLALGAAERHHPQSAPAGEGPDRRHSSGHERGDLEL